MHEPRRNHQMPHIFRPSLPGRPQLCKFIMVTSEASSLVMISPFAMNANHTPAASHATISFHQTPLSQPASRRTKTPFKPTASIFILGSIESLEKPTRTKKNWSIITSNLYCEVIQQGILRARIDISKTAIFPKPECFGQFGEKTPFESPTIWRNSQLALRSR